MLLALGSYFFSTFNSYSQSHDVYFTIIWLGVLFSFHSELFTQLKCLLIFVHVFFGCLKWLKLNIHSVSSDCEHCAPHTSWIANLMFGSFIACDLCVFFPAFSRISNVKFYLHFNCVPQCVKHHLHLFVCPIFSCIRVKNFVRVE